MEDQALFSLDVLIEGDLPIYHDYYAHSDAPGRLTTVIFGYRLRRGTLETQRYVSDCLGGDWEQVFSSDELLVTRIAVYHPEGRRAAHPPGRHRPTAAGDRLRVDTDRDAAKFMRRERGSGSVLALLLLSTFCLLELLSWQRRLQKSLALAPHRPPRRMPPASCRATDTSGNGGAYRLG
ncbi:hypothetical protein D8L93_10935 [Sodalis-like symbiont of Bactericera trigonica]|nr:hypothetical protein D8L93_10935 [Sodalis-like symbiont of Bactericera trigonica]